MTWLVRLKQLGTFLGLKPAYTACRRTYRAYKYIDWMKSVSREPVIGYVGWLGHGNFGDEILLECIKELMHPIGFVELFEPQDATPDFFYAIREWHSGKSVLAAIFIGGGTLINEAVFLRIIEPAIATGAPLYVFGSGAKDRSSDHAPGCDFDALTNRYVQILQKAKAVYVRGPHSARMLESSGVSNVSIIGDPGLSLPAKYLCEREQRNLSFCVGISIGSWDKPKGDQHRILEIVTELAKCLLASGFELRILNMQEIDIPVATALAERAGIDLETANNPNNVLETFQAIRQCDIVIGQRLHSVVVAAAMGIPCISLAYATKCKDFMASIKRENLSFCQM